MLGDDPLQRLAVPFGQDQIRQPYVAVADKKNVLQIARRTG
jgi:hypothetical protein